MNLNVLLGLLILATVAATYMFWVRPLLKATPSFGYLFADEERFWRAIRRKFDGLKQKLVTAVVTAAAFIVSAYDFIAPYVASAGVDVTQITDKVPSWAWPIIGAVLVLLVGKLRNIGETSLLTKIASGEAVVTLEAPTKPVVVPVKPEDAIPMAELLAESTK
jgi:hypothetical protein